MTVCIDRAGSPFCFAPSAYSPVNSSRVIDLLPGFCLDHRMPPVPQAQGFSTVNRARLISSESGPHALLDGVTSALSSNLFPYFSIMAPILHGLLSTIKVPLHNSGPFHLSAPPPPMFNLEGFSRGISLFLNLFLPLTCAPSFYLPSKYLLLESPRVKTRPPCRCLCASLPSTLSLVLLLKRVCPAGSRLVTFSLGALPLFKC